MPAAALPAASERMSPLPVTSAFEVPAGKLSGVWHAGRYVFGGLAGRSFNDPRPSDGSVVSVAVVDTRDGQYRVLPAINKGWSTDDTVGDASTMVRREQHDLPGRACPDSPGDCVEWRLYRQQLTSGSQPALLAESAVPGPEISIAAPVVSGDRVAWQELQADGSVAVYTAGLAHGEPRLLGRVPGPSISLTLDHDRLVADVPNCDGCSQTHLVTADLSADGQLQAVAGAANEHWPSLRGNWLTFVTGADGHVTDVKESQIVGANQDEPRLVVHLQDVYDARLTPDGTVVVYNAGGLTAYRQGKATKLGVSIVGGSGFYPNDFGYAMVGEAGPGKELLVVG